MPRIYDKVCGRYFTVKSKVRVGAVVQNDGVHIVLGVRR